MYRLIDLILETGVFNKYAGSNPNITWDDIINNPQLNWDPFYVSMNPNISWEIIIENLDYPWRMDVITKHVPWNFIIEHPNIEWDWINISYTAPWEIIYKYHNDPSFKWCWNHISINYNIAWKIIVDNPNLPWNWRSLSSNKNLTFENFLFVAERETLCWGYISRHKNTTWQNIMDNLDNPLCHWDWDFISDNPNVTWEIFISNINNPKCHWNLEIISERGDFSPCKIYSVLGLTPRFCIISDTLLDFIKKNPHLEHDWINISFNAPLNYIYENNTMPWNWNNVAVRFDVSFDDACMLAKKYNIDECQLSRNRNISVKIIKDNPTIKWNYSMICNNKMDQPYYITKLYNKALAKKTSNSIFNELISTVCHPSRPIENYMSTNDVEGHTLAGFSRSELEELSAIN